MFTLTDDQYNKAEELTRQLYNEKLIMKVEREVIVKILEILSFGWINEALKINDKQNQYVQYQLQKILKQVKK